MQLDPTVIGLASAALALAVLLVVLIGRRKNATTKARLQRASKAVLTHFLIPDGEGGEIHIEYAILCKRGIIIIDIKDVSGNVFGSDSMQDWAVISGKRRFTFNNPQPGLYDRVAAVKRTLPDIPVTGFIAFTHQAIFSKGRPAHVIGLEELLGELEKDHGQKNAAADAYWPAWEQLRSVAVITQMAKLTDR